MTLREKLEKRMKSNKRISRYSKIFMITVTALIFGVCLFFIQGLGYEAVTSVGVENYVEMSTEGRDYFSDNGEFFKNINLFIYNQYDYLNGISENLSTFFLFFSSLLPGLIIGYFYVSIMTHGTYYYDEIETTTITKCDCGSTESKNVDKSIYVLRVNKLEDIGDKYKINVTTYPQLSKKPGTEDYIVDKWKVRVSSRWSI